MKKFSTFVIGLLLFLGLNANAFASDLNISRPVGGERINGNYTVNWSVYNMGVASAEYQARLLNDACSAPVAGLASGIVQNGVASFGLNTNNFPDGSYCIEICVYPNQFSECVHTRVAFSNTTNSAPRITTNPATLNFNEGDVFVYQARAEDAEGDNIIFKLLSAPNFIYMSPSGYMTNGTYMPVGRYNISFAAEDANGARTTQSFTITVVQRPRPTGTSTPVATQTPVPTSTVPTQTPPPTGTLPAESPTPVPGVPQLDIVSPARADILYGNNNLIRWNAANIENANTLKLEFSTGGDNWVEILTTDDTGLRSYRWDVSALESGDYQVRVSYLANNSAVISDITERFLIAEKPVTEDLFIQSYEPGNNAEIQEKQPEISAEFEPSAEGEIVTESTKIELDGEDITEICSINDDLFRCQITEDLEVGEHEVRVTLEDSSGQTLSQSWKFRLIDGEAPQDEEAEDEDGGFNFPDFSLPSLPDINTDQLRSLIPCCVGLFIVLLAFFGIKIVRKKRNTNQQNSATGTDNFSPTPPPAAPAAANNNYDFDSFPEDEDENYDFSIGDHTLGANEFNSSAPVEPEAEPSEPASTAAMTPSFESTGPGNEEDLPDWLKGDTTSGAAPHGATGESMSVESQDIQDVNEGAKVHNDFGLTPTAGSDDKQA